jgi:hypothetical protein
MVVSTAAALDGMKLSQQQRQVCYEPGLLSFDNSDVLTVCLACGLGC